MFEPVPHGAAVLPPRVRRDDVMVPDPTHHPDDTDALTFGRHHTQVDIDAGRALTRADSFWGE